MRLRVSVTTAVVMMAILCILDMFVYFTIYSHLIQMEMSNLNTKVQSIAQYAVSHAQDGQPGPQSGQSPSNVRWLSHFVRDGQTGYIFDAHGRLIGSLGDIHVPPQQLPRLNSKASIGSTALPGKTSVLVASAPIIEDDTNRLLGYAELISDTEQQTSYLHELLTVLVIGTVGAVVVVAVAAYVISATALRPLYHMIRAISRIEASRLSERMILPTKRRDEVSQLAGAFNRMLERIERSFDQQARFVADASHEIRTPLTIIQGYANLLARWGKSDPQIVEQAISVIRRESTRLHNLANDLLTLARVEASIHDEAQSVDVNEVILETIQTLSPLYADRQIVHDLPGTVFVVAAPSHIKRICLNLLDNALKYTPQGGVVYVSTSMEHSEVALSIRDTGPGIPEADLPHIFERFYRVDKSRTRHEGGTGLGLALVKELVELYGGHVTIESGERKGTTARVVLPVMEKPPKS